MITPFTAPDRRSVFVPVRLVLETLAGELIEACDNPEAAFVGQVFTDPWDIFQAALFQQ